MARCPRTDPGRGAFLNRSSLPELSNNRLDDNDGEPAKEHHESKVKILLIQGGPGTNLGTSPSAGLLVIGGVTYSNSLSSNSKGSAAEPIPHTRGLVSEHLRTPSTIQAPLASQITLLVRTSSSS